MLNHVLNPFRDSPLSMGLTAWFRHDEDEQAPGPCPFTLMYGTTLWEVCSRDDAINALFNNSMAADSHFLMQIVLREFGEVFHGIDSLVDVAGGVGGAAMAIAAAFPCLKCTVLDLPHVVAKAPSSSIGNVQFVGGDMFESIPPANVVFLKVCRHVVIFVSFLLSFMPTLLKFNLRVQILIQTNCLLNWFCVLSGPNNS